MNYEYHKFKPGDIVFWVERNKVNRPMVRFGIVDDEFSDGYRVDRIDIPYITLVNDIPLEEFNDFEWHRLPKGWSWDTELIKVEKTFPYNIYNIVDLLGDRIRHQTESIKTLVEHGIYKKCKDIDKGTIEAQVENGKWRCVKKYPESHNPDTKHLMHYCAEFDYPDKPYPTYEEAEKQVKREEAELQRLANLSDYDWSVEQIEKTLAAYGRLRGADKEQRVREQVMALDNLEDVETRFAMGGNFQYRRVGYKKWTDIVP